MTRELLAACAVPRQRVADEHMFTVTRGDGFRIGTFRLQLFTAAGARPVAIATQMAGEGGSLTNRAETYAAEVWRRHFPDAAEPPVWIELQLFPGIPDHQERFTLVTFSGEQPHQLAGPGWCRISDADVARLVGTEVDRGRGNGYQPWPPQPEEEPVYKVAWLVLLPRPAGVNRGCMDGAAPWRRCAGRQLIPRRGTRDCCYYHSVNWHQVSAAAIRITRQARAEGLAGWAFAERVTGLADAQEGLPPAEKEALAELLDGGTAIQPTRNANGRFYVNGRHRTTAMLDAGVRRTIIITWKMPDTTEASH